MRGPKKKPAEIAAKQGNPGKQKRHRPAFGSGRALLDASARATTAPSAPETDPPAITPPADLDPLALPLWTEAVRWLSAVDMLKQTDLGALARYCEYYVLWRAARTALSDTRAKSGLRITYTTRSKHGNMERLRPQWRAMMDCEQQLRQLEDRFGLSPSMRTQLAVRMASASDPTKPAMSRRLGQPAGSEAPPPSTTAPDGRPLPPAPASPIGHLGKPRNLN